MAGSCSTSGVEHISGLKDGRAVLSCPVGHRRQGVAKSATELRELVVNPWRNRRIYGARNQAVAFEPTQREREHALGDVLDRVAQLVEAHGAASQ